MTKNLLIISLISMLFIAYPINAAFSNGMSPNTCTKSVCNITNNCWCKKNNLLFFFHFLIFLILLINFSGPLTTNPGNFSLSDLP